MSLWGSLSRPTIYSNETAAQLCGYLAIGESLRKACGHSGMPSVATVFLWKSNNPEFLEQYVRAKQEAADMFAEQIIDIADNHKKDRLPIYDVDEEGKKVLIGYKESKNSVRRAAIQIQARMWAAGKYKPHSYGDKLNVDANHTGTITTRKYQDMSDDELAKLATEKLKEIAESNEQSTGA